MVAIGTDWDIREAGAVAAYFMRQLDAVMAAYAAGQVGSIDVVIRFKDGSVVSERFMSVPEEGGKDADN